MKILIVKLFILENLNLVMDLYEKSPNIAPEFTGKEKNPYENTKLSEEELDVVLDPIREELESINNLNKKFIQAFNLRTELIKTRLDALEDLKKVVESNSRYEDKEKAFRSALFTSKVIQTLQRCNKNERNLIVIIERSEDATLKLLDKNIERLEKIAYINDVLYKKYKIKISQMKKILIGYANLVINFYKNLDIVKSRLDLESEFLKNQSIRYAKLYLDLLYAEISLQKTLEKSIIELISNKNFNSVGAFFSAVGLLTVPNSIESLIRKAEMVIISLQNNQFSYENHENLILLLLIASIISVPFSLKTTIDIYRKQKQIKSFTKELKLLSKI